ncbi:hypothetical protein P154DRAFT_573160 [Amniculicola lignicola CBS 123094]|uniref:Cora-domain-containing protein n=1 Tax=Amniculicola lignicola CBS 123094 TaxID=1392246 RepID=A0A6A5WNV8_9PLEO|nr:hypothetical protein P154DRAFT_573160 [Amniculicola lignicola CBS 123094]
MQYEAKISSIDSQKEWGRFIETDLPSIDGTESGMVLLIAKRSGEPGLREVRNVTPNSWIEQANLKIQPKDSLRIASTFSPLQEKEQPVVGNTTSPKSIRPKGVRTVPFTRDTFELVTQSFYTHNSTARVISRTDVPAFMAEKLTMREAAYVYNCRSSNAWDGDLALSMTHFPRTRLTFAILFGCPFETEKEIVMRLAQVKEEACHPLLLPGMFAEIERARHTILVEEMGNTLETMILQLDYYTDEKESQDRALVEERNREKRTAYLDLAYLRNSLLTWNTQLAKMIQHCRYLSKEEYSNTRNDGVMLQHRQKLRDLRIMESVMSRGLEVSRRPAGEEIGKAGASTEAKPLIQSQYKAANQINTAKQSMDPHESDESDGWDDFGDISDDSDEYEKIPGNDRIGRAIAATPHGSSKPLSLSRRAELSFVELEKIRDTGDKIENRLMSLRDEYDDRIRDCTLRVDGMAMATQWAQGETNVEIALATNRDSRHMRSIALVTMIFLPGTFFASMFSMTFFNWSSDPGSPTVSAYLWVYVLMTVLSTSLTIGLWYYVVVYRVKRAQKKDARSI